MPVAFDTAAEALTIGGGPATATLTVATNTNRALVALVVVQTAGTPVVSNITGAGATWSTVKDGSVQLTSQADLEIWHGINPSTGAQTVTVTMTDTTANEIELVVESWFNVDQTTPVASYQSIANAVSPGISITTVNGDAVGGMYVSALTSGIPAGCQTTDDTSQLSNEFYQSGHCLAVGVATSMKWTSTASASVNGIAIKQLAAAVSSYGSATPDPGRHVPLLGRFQ